MPTFSNMLPEKTQTHGYDLRRTPPDHPLKGIITCDEQIGCYTHWWGGRTVPCEDADCEACKVNTPARWHCYLSVCESGTHDHFIFECTGKAALPLVLYKRDFGSLRGAFITAFRPKRRRNARVELILKPFDISKIRLPDPPDLMIALSVIWQLPADSLRIGDISRETPLIAIDQEILNSQRLNPADGNGRPKTKKKVTA